MDSKVKYDSKELVKMADDNYLDLMRSGNYKDIIEHMGDLGNYTLRNQLLIRMQMPNATRISSMKGWNFNKRSVIKDQEPIRIIAPVFAKMVTTESDGKITEKTSDYVSDYKVNFVYDYSQTEGEEIKPLINKESVETYYDTVQDTLQKMLKGYTFKEREIEAEGILDTRNRTITINQNLDKENYLKTLVKQVAAALVVGRNRDKFQGLKQDDLSNVNSIEISAVSDILLKKLGLTRDTLGEPDVSQMEDGDITKFAGNLGIMRSVSQLMINGIENALSDKMLEENLEKAQEAEDELLTTVTQTTVSKTTTKTRSKSQAEM